MILLLDNYDSFTYNIYQYMSELGAEVKVIRNDKISLSEIKDLNPEKIVVSPGPCTLKRQEFQMIIKTLERIFQFGSLLGPSMYWRIFRWNCDGCW